MDSVALFCVFLTLLFNAVPTVIASSAQFEPGSRSRSLSQTPSDIPPEGGSVSDAQPPPSSEPAPEPFAEVDAQSIGLLGECSIETGIAYPRGNILLRTMTQTHDACCELCRNNNDCFSWYRHEKTDRCTLNSNTPSVVRRGRNFAGGVIF